jgi:hypothetical protein
MRSAPPILAESISRHLGHRPSLFGRTKAAPAARNAPAPVVDQSARLVELLTQARLLAPPDAIPLSVGGIYQDAAPVDGTTAHQIVTYTVPSGFRFIVRRRIVLLDTTATPTGGVILKADTAEIHNGYAGPSGLTPGPGAVAGEFLGASGSDQEFAAEFRAGVVLDLSAKLTRGAAAISCSVLAQLVGYLVREV